MSFLLKKIVPQTPSEWLLIIANLCLLVLALVYNWSLFDIVFAFWIENLIIGLFNTPKILMCKVQHPGHRPDTLGTKIFLVFFFWFHYTVFSALHLFLIFLLFGDAKTLLNPSEIFSGMFSFFFILGLIGLFASHGFSFYSNFIQKKEYEKYSPFAMMLKPYIRVLLTHGFVFLGGYVVLLIDNGMSIMLVVFIILKTLLDLSAHKKAHDQK